jgi:hypothetical protein
LIIFRDEWIDKRDVLHDESILKVFGEHMLHSGTVGRGPQHSIPKCEAMGAHGLKRPKQIAVVGGLDTLPYNHMRDKYCHMKTTLNINDRVMLQLKREAARQGRTMSEMVESALRLLLRSQRKREKIAPLPTFRSGGALVDIADRDALYQAMEGR